MGVLGLWGVLEPASRGVAVKQLSGHRLAVDASIFMLRIIYSFIKEESSLFSQHYLDTLLKRLVRLLDAKIRPVFVFDGPAPPLKRDTIRRRA